MEKELIKVSIIMPVYNSQKYLKNAIESILNQNFEGFELILVDDGSTDKSGMICDQYGKSDSRVKVIHKKNGGICSARNAGLFVSMGQYIGFCDNDDRYLPDLIKDNYALAKRYDADIVRYNRKRVRTGDRKETEVNFMPSGIHVFREREIDRNYLCIRRCSVAVWSALYKKEFLNKNRLCFLEQAKFGLEDRIFNIKAYEYAKCIVLNSKVYYEWIRREEHSTSDKFHMNLVQTIFYCIKTEKITYLKRSVETYAPGYWNEIVLFYILFLFWSMDRKCSKLSFLVKLQLLRRMRNYPYIIHGLEKRQCMKMTRGGRYDNFILFFFYHKWFLLEYGALKIRGQEY